MKWDFWKSELSFDAEEARVELGKITQLKSSPGWEWLQEELVTLSNVILAKWKKGEHTHVAHERMAGQVDLIGTILDLPDERERELLSQLKTEREVNLPDPVDDDQMSPIPDESPDYLDL